MRIARKSRNLSGDEINLAAQVFQDSLPSWGRIFITDGLGPIPGYDNPYTQDVKLTYSVNVGPEVYPDATLTTDYLGFGTYRNILIHEMTHVWQYYHGYWVILRSIWANRHATGYEYTIEASDAWDDFNVEQQAHLVEDWFDGGMLPTDSRFVFIEKIIRAGVKGGIWASMLDVMLIKMPLDKLRDWSG
jgi:hypothetical protein